MGNTPFGTSRLLDLVMPSAKCDSTDLSDAVNIYPTGNAKNIIYNLPKKGKSNWVFDKYDTPLWLTSRVLQ